MQRPLIVLLVVLGTLCANANLALSGVILPNLPPGSQYQLVFTTKDYTTGVSSDIDTYNAFVTAEAAKSPALPKTTWHAVVSTGLPASLNAPSNGLPVYNTLGQLVATAATGLYTPNLLIPLAWTQYGSDQIAGLYAWTGFDYTGQASTFPLGTNNPYGYSFGYTRLTNASWADAGPLSAGDTSLAIYALSSPITVVPEPATAMMVLTGALVLWATKRFFR